ncbi:MAG: alpha/beta hydrolase [Steroidobacteraceae bacterium]
MSQDRRAHDDAVRVRAADSYLQIDGARLRYRDEGSGQAVIFIHGWTLDLDMWEPQAAALASHCRVIRLDRRGHGLSSGQPSPAGDLADLGALCRHLGLRQVAVAGMSQGARTALEFSCSSPAMISCLVLDGAPQIGTSGAQDIPYEHYRTLARRQGMAAFRREWAKHPLAGLRTGDRRARQLLAQMIERYPGNDLTGAPAQASGAVACMPADIRIPALVISGEFDLESRRTAADELASQLPQAERAQIPGAGHLCNLDNPEAYNAAISGFFARHAIHHRTS